MIDEINYNFLLDNNYINAFFMIFIWIKLIFFYIDRVELTISYRTKK